MAVGQLFVETGVCRVLEGEEEVDSTDFGEDSEVGLEFDDFTIQMDLVSFELDDVFGGRSILESGLFEVVI